MYWLIVGMGVYGDRLVEWVVVVTAVVVDWLHYGREVLGLVCLVVVVVVILVAVVVRVMVVE